MSEHFSAILAVLHFGVLVVVLPRLVSSSRPAASIIAWSGALIFAPALGVIAYFIIGDYRTSPARKARFVEAASRLADWQAASPMARKPETPVERYLSAASGFGPASSACAELFRDAEAFFAALLDEIRQATESCDLGFYIWESGGLADDVESALREAVSRGVRCRVLLDGLGSRPFLGSKSAAELRAAGVEVVVASPLSLVGARWDLRYHRKLAVFDGRRAFVGSQNLADPRYFKQESGVGQWVDAMIRLDGGAAACLAAVFERDWMVESGEPFTLPSHESDSPEGTIVQVLPTAPEVNHDAARQLMLMAAYQAEQTLSVTTPYFAPDEALLNAIVNAAQRGVDVTLIVPATNDSRLVAHASASYFRILIPAGVRVARFRGGLLHTKSLVVDRSLTVFGSVNLDMRSLWLDAELSIVSSDSKLAADVLALHHDYLAHCDLVEEVPASSTLGRFVDNLARLFSPLL